MKCGFLVAAVLGICYAEQLPLKSFTTADGLAHNSVNRIMRDSYGYLWFCTSEGLSRFDGYEFHNYGRRDGLPHRDVHDLIEAKDGDFWIATAGGVCRYRPAAPPAQRFHAYLAPGDDRALYVNALLEDKRGQVWCGTDGGVFRMERAFRPVELGMPDETSEDRITSAFVEDHRGDIWIGAGSGLYRLKLSGAVERYTTREGLPHDFITALMEDRQQRIWAGTRAGMCRLTADPVPGRRVVDRVLHASDGIAGDYIQALHQLADGRIWVGTSLGLSVLDPISTYTTAHGLSEASITALGEDIAGNLWLGTDGSGAAKLPLKTFVTYTAADGLAGDKVDSMFEEENGKLCVVTRKGTANLFLNEFDGKRFRPTRVNLPPGTALVSWGAHSQGVARDRDGNWWFATASGLLKYGKTPDVPALARKEPDNVYSARDGLSASAVLAVFADGDGEIWVSTTGELNGLARWDRNSRSFRGYSDADGFPLRGPGGVSLFSADGPGRLWMGVLRFGPGQSQMARLQDGRFQFFGGKAGSPGGIRALCLDHRKRLWAGTSQNGIIQIENAEGPEPRLTNITTADGLSSDLVLSLAEDFAGRIYIGMGGGVDRLDPETGRIKRYTVADGLSAGEIQAAFRDHTGAMWFGGSNGLSRLIPQVESAVAPPPIRITSLLAGGSRQPISELGETELAGLRYPANRNHIQIEFVGLGFEPGETLRYQYMLDGADHDWNAPARQRSVNYANLGPGKYRFLARALNSQGVASTRPASIAFVILPPIWMRWWFQLAFAATMAGIIYWIHRYRMARLLEVERIRTRIATDLHDDIGSSLSQIAILSEVAHRGENGAQAELAEIAGISRELVHSMSDIVWAVDPEQDQLRDLTHRMRRFAADVFSPRGVRLEFRAPPEEQDLELDVDLRRQVFLIFKEALHNVARHSDATAIEITFQVRRGWLQLTVRDDGHGFDIERGGDGHGLKSMRERAAKLGGELEIKSGANGTTVYLRTRTSVGTRHLPK